MLCCFLHKKYYNTCTYLMVDDNQKSVHEFHCQGHRDWHYQDMMTSVTGTQTVY